MLARAIARAPEKSHWMSASGAHTDAAVIRVRVRTAGRASDAGRACVRAIRYARRPHLITTTAAPATSRGGTRVARTHTRAAHRCARTYRRCRACRTLSTVCCNRLATRHICCVTSVHLSLGSVCILASLVLPVAGAHTRARAAVAVRATTLARHGALNVSFGSGRCNERTTVMTHYVRGIGRCTHASPADRRRGVWLRVCARPSTSDVSVPV